MTPEDVKLIIEQEIRQNLSIYIAVDDVIGITVEVSYMGTKVADSEICPYWIREMLNIPHSDI